MKTAATIRFYRGNIQRGGWPTVAISQAEPHPFDDSRLAAHSADEVFAHVAARRAQVAATLSRFESTPDWMGTMEYIDQLDPTCSIASSVRISDNGLFVRADIDAITADGEDLDEVYEVQDHLLIFPQHRLLTATSHRIAPMLQDGDAQVRRYMFAHVRRSRRFGGPESLVFQVPGSAGEVPPYSESLRAFELMLVRAILRWARSWDLTGRGLRSNQKALLAELAAA